MGGHPYTRGNDPHPSVCGCGSLVGVGVGWHLKPMGSPMQITTRNQEGDITHYVLLTVGVGKHAEKLWCVVMCLGKVPLILSHDWL